jgi:RNA polymerase sigma-70 factor, ECF subfamily
VGIQESPPCLRLLPPVNLGELSDVELVSGLQADLPWARREIWDRYSADVRGYLARALGRPGDEVGDLTQEVFLRIFHGRAAIRRPEALRQFTRGVAVRVLQWDLRRRWVRRKIRLSADGRLPEVAVDPEQEDRAMLLRCRRVLDTLDARERTAFTLRFMEGLTFEDVSESMNISYGTAIRLTHRATRAIADQLRGDPLLRRGRLDPREGGAR